MATRLYDSFTFHHRRNANLDERLEGWWGSHNKVLGTVCLMVLILTITLSHYHDFLGKGTPPTLSVRTACSPCAGGSLPAYCALPEEYQFSKVIWFITDGYPMYMQKKWLSMYADHAIPFTVGMPGNRWSHSIYTSWFTGMPNVNLLARPIYGDNLFESMQRSGGKRCSLDPLEGMHNASSTFAWRWIGPLWCPVELLGGAERAKSDLGFVQINDITEDLETAPHPYPSIPHSSLPNLLNSVAERGQSLITHTGIIDKEAHYGVNSEASEQYLFDLFASSGLREFIDAHPDYLLILSSDHGRSKKGKFHGEGTTTMSGNIGMVTFYNPIFHGQNMSEIDVVDVHPTIAKYLKGVDISHYSVGEVRNTYGPEGGEFVLNALKQNLAQLTALMIQNEEEVDMRVVHHAMHSDDEGVVRTVVRNFKSRLFNPMIRPFYKYTLLGLLVLIAVCFVYWLRVVNNSQLLFTLLLCVPLGFSLGFFLKPLTSYHFQSNFTYYFGMATSFLLASGLSELRITAYLILNELFNVCGFLFRHYLSAASFAPYVGLILSLLESLYYETNLRVRRFTFLLHLLNFLFLTVPFFFPEIYGFNLSALLIYLSIPYVFILTLADFTLRASSALPLSSPILSLLSASLTSVLLLLHNCSPLVALVNFQARQILPCLFGKAHFAYDAVRGYAVSHRGLQACAIYVLQQAFWVTWWVWGLSPDLDIDPRAGVAGIHNWNEHPVIAGFLLGLQKLGVFPLLALHIGAIIIPNLFPLFLYFALTIVNCFSIHMCFKKFQFKTQIETLMILTLCTFIQFILVILVKFGAKPEFDDRSPWGFHVVNRVSHIWRRITSLCRRSRY